MTDIDVSGDALDATAVRGLVNATVAAEGAKPSRVSVSFADEATMRQLNARHRGKDRATDVLSFPFDDSFPQGSGGEVVVCPAIVTALAAKDGREEASALQETIVHGVLHVLGHQDDTAAGAREMDRRTRRILEAG
jgi:probable rRNA maturation factor